MIHKKIKEKNSENENFQEPTYQKGEPNFTGLEGSSVNLYKKHEIPTEVFLNDDRAEPRFNSLYACTPQRMMWEENPFIQRGYRSETLFDLQSCSLSIMSLHNDTCNIWTHLIGALYEFYLMWELYHFQGGSLNGSQGGKWALMFYLYCNLQCYIISTFYHTFRTYSSRTYLYLLTADISGILCLVSSAPLLLSFFEMTCHPSFQTLYLSLISLIALFGIYYCPWMMKNKRFSLRTLTFCSIASLGLICWLHHFYLIGSFWTLYNFHSLSFLFSAYLWISMSLTIRRTQIPEKLIPKVFDYFSSHTIFHIFVVIGSNQIYWSYREIFEWNITCPEHVTETSFSLYNFLFSPLF